MIVPSKAIAATLTTAAHKEDGKSPGTRGKSMAMLRAELIKAREYLDKQQRAEKAAQAEPKGENAEKSDAPETANKPEPPARDLRLEALADELKKNRPLMVTADRAQEIMSALRLAKEFDFTLWLDGGSEAYLLIEEIKASGFPMLSPAPMQRAFGKRANHSMETASKLVRAGIPVALQAGYESYVPKTRVVLFEAAIAAANAPRSTKW